MAFIGAGLTWAISDVTADEVLTFLRRAERHALASVSRADVELALREPIEASGRHMSDKAPAVMAQGTQGYPFLIQLVGVQTWRRHPRAPSISVGDAELGVANALRRLGSLVYEPALAGRSAIDRSFLLAMALDDGRRRWVTSSIAWVSTSDCHRRSPSACRWVVPRRLRVRLSRASMGRHHPAAIAGTGDGRDLARGEPLSAG